MTNDTAAVTHGATSRNSNKKNRLAPLAKTSASSFRRTSARDRRPVECFTYTPTAYGGGGSYYDNLPIIHASSSSSSTNTAVASSSIVPGPTPASRAGVIAATTMNNPPPATSSATSYSSSSILPARRTTRTAMMAAASAAATTPNNKKRKRLSPLLPSSTSSASTTTATTSISTSTTAASSTGHHDRTTTTSSSTIRMETPLVMTVGEGATVSKEVQVSIAPSSLVLPEEDNDKNLVAPTAAAAAVTNKKRPLPPPPPPSLLMATMMTSRAVPTTPISSSTRSSNSKKRHVRVSLTPPQSSSSLLSHKNSSSSASSTLVPCPHTTLVASRKKRTRHNNNNTDTPCVVVATPRNDAAAIVQVTLAPSSIVPKKLSASKSLVAAVVTRSLSSSSCKKQKRGFSTRTTKAAATTRNGPICDKTQAKTQAPRRRRRPRNSPSSGSKGHRRRNGGSGGHRRTNSGGRPNNRRTKKVTPLSGGIMTATTMTTTLSVAADKDVRTSASSKTMTTKTASCAPAKPPFEDDKGHVMTMETHGLVALTQELLALILNSDSFQVTVRDACRVLGPVHSPQIHDIVDILQGAHVLVPVDSDDNNTTTTNKRFRLHESMCTDSAVANHAMRVEEMLLDSWIHQLPAMAQHNGASQQQQHLCAHDLSRLLDKDSTMLAIATPRNTSVLQHQQGLSSNYDRHSFALMAPPTEMNAASIPTTALVLEPSTAVSDAAAGTSDHGEHDADVREVSLVPPPPFLTPTRPGCHRYATGDSSSSSLWLNTMVVDGHAHHGCWNVDSMLMEGEPSSLEQDCHGAVMSTPSPPSRGWQHFSNTHANVVVDSNDMVPVSLDEEQVAEDASNLFRGLFDGGDDLQNDLAPLESTSTTTDENHLRCQFPALQKQENQPLDTKWTPKSNSKLIHSAQPTPDDHSCFANMVLSPSFSWTTNMQDSNEETFTPRRCLWDAQSLSPSPVLPCAPPLAVRRANHDFVPSCQVTTAPPMPPLLGDLCTSIGASTKGEQNK